MSSGGQTFCLPTIPIVRFRPNVGKRVDQDKEFKGHL